METMVSTGMGSGLCQCRLCLADPQGNAIGSQGDESVSIGWDRRFSLVNPVATSSPDKSHMKCHCWIIPKCDQPANCNVIGRFFLHSTFTPHRPEEDGLPPSAGFLSRFLPVREFFLATIWGFLSLLGCLFFYLMCLLFAGSGSSLAFTHSLSFSWSAKCLCNSLLKKARYKSKWISDARYCTPWSRVHARLRSPGSIVEIAVMSAYVCSIGHSILGEHRGKAFSEEYLDD